MDAYFSADVETDGPIPGPFSMLSFAIVYAGHFDGIEFHRPRVFDKVFYRELKPISDEFQQEALDVNGLDRDRLILDGCFPESAMLDAATWIKEIAGSKSPVLVAFPLSFDWTWIYWYFVKFGGESSPFKHSSCLDIKTAFAIKAGVPISEAGRKKIPDFLQSRTKHTHHASDDAVSQAEIFANIFEWKGRK